MKKTEEVMGAKFGDPKNPLLVSCRSGARVSMPGMMDTVLNIGLNESTLKGLIEKTGNERFAWDSYRRFVQMYGDVVLGLKPTSKTEIDPFEHIMEELKHEKKAKLDTDLTTADLKELVKRFKKAVKDRTGKDFPDDAYEQMYGAVAAVFNSWGNDRAVVYRRQYGYPHDWGTAANICSMVFGNMGDDCCTGVAFTRDPATGEKVFYGEYLINAQGEDVVAGIRTPKKIAELQKDMPAVYKQLDEIRNTLEKHYRDVQDIEFTVQKQKLWMLQTRNGKRTGFAGVRFAVDMVEEGLITKEEALSAGRLPPDDLESAFAADLQSGSQTQGHRRRQIVGQGHQRRPWRCHRQDHVPRRGRRSLYPQAQRHRGWSRHPGPPRNQPRRLARHAGCQRHSHGFRRCVVPCRPGQPADGQGLHRRLQRTQYRLSQGHDDRRRQGPQGRRLDQHRRLHRRSAWPARSPPSRAKSCKF